MIRGFKTTEQWKGKAPRGFRRGVAAVELAILLPLLVFLFLIAVDFGRIFYFSVTISNCARNGALWQSDPYARVESPYTTLEEAALADAFDLGDSTNKPEVTSKTGTDSTSNAYVEVTVTYHFRTVTPFPLIPSDTQLSRTVRMPVAPENPDL
jgi:Flp pilus assembly protein TadG